MSLSVNVGQDLSDGKSQLDENHEIVISEPCASLGKPGSADSNFLDNGRVKRSLSGKKDGIRSEIRLNWANSRLVRSAKVIIDNATQHLPPIDYAAR